MPYRRKHSPYWWIDYTDAGGTRVRRSAGTTRYAEAKALEAKAVAEAYADKSRAQTTLSFELVMLHYLQGHAHKRSADRDRVIAATLRRAFQGADMLALKPAAIRAFIGTRRSEGIRDSTIGRELALLSAAINDYAAEQGIALPNPVRGRKPKQGEGRVRWITRQEAERLIEAAGKRTDYLADFIRLALNTGCRKQELLGLEWSRVSLAERLIFLESRHTKNGKRRGIPINETATRALLACWNRAQAASNPSPWVFGNPAGGRLQSVRKSFRTACREAGIVDFRIHDLRHTCAAWLVSGGAPLSAVRDLLGHSSVTVTEIYAHLAPAAVRAAVNQLDDCHTGWHSDLEMVATGGLEPPTPAL